LLKSPEKKESSVHSITNSDAASIKMLPFKAGKLGLPQDSNVIIKRK
jgi:hypothetical protein